MDRNRIFKFLTILVAVLMLLIIAPAAAIADQASVVSSLSIGEIITVVVVIAAGIFTCVTWFKKYIGEPGQMDKGPPDKIGLSQYSAILLVLLVGKYCNKKNRDIG